MDDWKRDLASIHEQRDQRQQSDDAQLDARKAEAASWFTETVMPAMEELKTELEKNGRRVSVRCNRVDTAGISIGHGLGEGFGFAVRARITGNGRRLPRSARPAAG